MRQEHTKVVVSVIERSQRDIKKEYDGAEIEWDVADKQLLDWDPYFQKGKRLQLNLLFSFTEPSSQSAGRSARRGDKRGSTSASSRMLAERDQEIATEQEETGRPPTWHNVYAFMRCPTSCESGPYCWIDSEGSHHRMKPEYFGIFELYVAQHGGDA